MRFKLMRIIFPWHETVEPFGRVLFLYDLKHDRLWAKRREW